MSLLYIFQGRDPDYVPETESESEEEIRSAPFLDKGLFCLDINDDEVNISFTCFT